ncbi:hypothetical protein BD408DRAFT_413801 [Parasitella parasitica]|nr:hypothetical protein BD408DRAFT_413801 [Parasitella parasitica]
MLRTNNTLLYDKFFPKCDVDLFYLLFFFFISVLHIHTYDTVGWHFFLKKKLAKNER